MHKNNESKNALHSNLFVVPTVKIEDEQFISSILRSHFARRRGEDHSLWLIGVKMQGESDDKSVIKERFSFLDLDYDDDVFVFMGEDGLGWRLHEIYKISENDKDIIVLPFGKWLPNGNLVVDQPEKYIRRKNLMVIRSEVYDTTKYMFNLYSIKGHHFQIASRPSPPHIMTSMPLTGMFADIFHNLQVIYEILNNLQSIIKVTFRN